MRILEHFFPNRELNLQSLKSIARDITNGAVENGVASQPPGSEGQQSSEPEDERKDTEPDVESLNALHDPLGCMMKDSMGKYRE